MPRPSRRAFLATTGAGAAAGILAATPLGADAAPLKTDPRAAEPMIVHIADPDGAQLLVHAGEHTTVVHDRELVVRIQNAVAKAS